MKNKYRILKIGITVILLGFLLSFSWKRFNERKITDDKISVKLNEGKTSVYFVDEKEIKNIVKSSNPGGKISDLNVPKLEQKLNAFPAIDSANVYLNLNGNLNVDIKQRVPVFRLSSGGKDFYVDEKGIEFPISENYSHPCMLVAGNVQPREYKPLVRLIKKIDKDDFTKQYFIGISKENDDYNLLTNDGFYKVEIGDLNNIDFKMKGFKAFTEKILANQNPRKYRKISVKYGNQIVTTLNPNFKESDSTDLKTQDERSPLSPEGGKNAKEKIAQNNKDVKPQPKPETKPKPTEKPETKVKIE
ncbi:MAG: cell division protein FtsQ [Flavobacteriaceae bacterium]|jgi:cell division protein FtsQ|nr:cell division protein FtsQ [Flavobacteriaceae bacterium]